MLSLSKRLKFFADRAHLSLAVIDAALSDDPTDAECTAALEVWFSDFSDVIRRQMSSHCTLVNRMSRALIAARNVEHVG
jgi:hypothetical protein